MKINLRKINKEDNKQLKDILIEVLNEFEVPEEGTALGDDELNYMFESYNKKRHIYYVLEINNVIMGGAGIAPLKKSKKNICEEHGIIIGSKTYTSDTPKLDGRYWNKNSNKKFIISNNQIISEPFIQINYEKKSIIKSVIDFLFKKNIQSVIVEGGLKTLDTFIDSGFWDEARIFKSITELKKGTKAPSIIGSLLLQKQIDNDQLSIIKNIQ